MDLRTIVLALCLGLLAACGGGSTPRSANEPVIPPPPPEPPPTHELMVRGEVFSFEWGMIPTAEVNLWMLPALSDAGWWNPGPMHSDELGLFETDVPAPSYISVLVFKNGYVQPCAVQHYVENDIEVRVEMEREEALGSTNPPRPQLSSEPSLTGTIFEETADGRQIVSGAYVWIDDGHGVGFAYTYSDLAGHYYLCRLPFGSIVYVMKNGYETRVLGPIDTSESIVLDVVLEREES